MPRCRRRPSHPRPPRSDAMAADQPASVPAFLYGTAWKEERTQALTWLEHPGTDRVAGCVLRGPASGHGWTGDGALVWAAMAKERDAGRTRLLGASNVSLRHLAQMAATGAETPAFVQNRCFARLGWDRAVRAFCAQRSIVYQGFSLLTANPEVLQHPLVSRLAARLHATRPQIVFRFGQAVGMLPLTGTTDPEHMTQDLASRDLAPSADEVRAIESLAG